MNHSPLCGPLARALLRAVRVLPLLVLAVGGAHAAGACRVATDGTGDGSNWASAASLQAALADAACTEIWVRQGTYLPTAGNDRSIGFAINRPLKLYGGFAGAETALAQRSSDVSLTVLSGNIGDPASRTDNSLHVVVIGGLDVAGGNGVYTSADTAIDGLTIAEGYARDDAADPFAEFNGGGLHCNGWGAGKQCGVALDNVVFRDNEAKTRGGAIYLTGSGSLAIAKSTFRANSSRYGGAIRVAGNNSNATTISQSTFAANTALSDGGAVYLSDDGFTISQSTFTGNTAQWGSAVVAGNATSSGRIQQSTFTGNSASDRATVNLTGAGPTSISQSTFISNSSTWPGAAVYLWSGSGHSVASSIFGQGSAPAQSQFFARSGSAIAVSNSIVQGGCTARVNCTATTDADPALQAIADNGGPTQTMLPGAGSPAIDMAGSCTAETTDQRGLARNVNGHCDLGAVELQPPSAPTAVAATAGIAQATVHWTAPASDGAITRYTVTAVEDASRSCLSTAGSPVATTCTVTGLTGGTAYTFAVVASSAQGAGSASTPSAPVTPTAAAVADPDPAGPSTLPISTPGTTTITDPALPVVLGPDAGGGTIVLPGTGTTPVTLQVTINGQPLQVQALPGTQLRIAQIDGQSVLVLVVLQGWAQMTSSAVGQPLVLAGAVLLSSGSANTRVQAQPLVVAVEAGSLVPPTGSLPEVGRMGLQAGERLQVDASGAVVSITLGSLGGSTAQPGDAMAFANLPAAITVDEKVFARLGGSIARLGGVSLAQGLETAPSGVVLVRDGAQVFQLLPLQPITIDVRQPDGVAFTPLGLLRWVRGGVVVQFAPAVADLAGLAQAVSAALPDGKLKLGAEGVLQLRTGGRTYVLRPDWTGGGAASTGTPQVGLDGQGRIYLQAGQGVRQWLLPSLLNHTQASAILSAALPGASLAVQPSSSDGAMTLGYAGQQWRLVPQRLLPEGNAANVPPLAGPWWMGSDGLLYLRLGGVVQGVRITD